MSTEKGCAQVDESDVRLRGELKLEDIAQVFRESLMTAEKLAESFLRSAIMRGFYRPGDRLQQDEVAKVLGISRIPVRSGLRQLEEEGLVTMTPHRGAIVTQHNLQQIAEIYELRTVLECYLLEHCMARITPAEVAELRGLADELEVPAGETETLSRRVGFYERLYRIADRPQALKMVARLRAQVDRYLLAKRVVPEPAGHTTLLDRIAVGDLDGAQRWIRNHLGAVSTELQTLITEPDRAQDAGDGAGKSSRLRSQSAAAPERLAGQRRGRVRGPSSESGNGRELGRSGRP
jgi:DNA-binding GntR family transcriptional regulator